MRFMVLVLLSGCSCRSACSSKSVVYDAATPPAPDAAVAVVEPLPDPPPRPPNPTRRPGWATEKVKTSPIRKFNDSERDRAIQLEHKE